MSAVTATKYTKEERELFRAKREEFRTSLKALAEAQTADKKLLRLPHYSLPEVVIKSKWGDMKYSGTSRAAHLMGVCRERAAAIDSTLDAYWRFRGKTTPRSDNRE
jgi:hypothetical protein